jgi:hypothetical protein
MKKKIKYALIALFVMVSFASKAHEYYIAIFEINESRDGKSLQISAKFIAHDVEEAMMRQDYPYLNMNSRNEHPDADSLLFDYFQRNFKVVINQTPQSLNYVGKELALDEDLWIYVEIILEEPIKQLSLTNTLLIREFPKQQNIVYSKIGVVNKTTIFTNEIIEQTLTL